MKKLYYLSALALTGAMSVASCSSEEEVKPQNGKREEVKTSFTLSVGSVKPGTRMSTDEVQADNAFNGMTGIQLFPFNCDANVGVDGTNPITISPIHLADFDEFQEESANAMVYNDITIPVGVNNFVFYGMSLKAEEGALKASYDNKALTTASTLATDVFFDLVSWNPGRKYNWFNTDQADGAKEVLDILNSVNTALNTQIAAYTTTDDAGETTIDPVATKLEEIQKSLQALTAGSSNSVRLFLQKVYDRLVGLNSKYYTDPITTVIGTAFDITGDATTGHKLEWKTDPKFPGRYNLPDGAVAVTFGNDFQYANQSVEGLEMAEVEKFMQPARLAYWVNTPAKTLNETYFDKYDPQNWKTAVDAYTTNAVSLSTQSVILEKQIQYAVARLDASVKVTTEPVYDNGKDKIKDDDQLVIVPQEGYKMTGVLIGGQKQVNWEFQPIGSEEFTIYDKAMTTTEIYAKTGSYSKVNHTLALETEENAKVRVCFEFVNTGNDFFGYNNQIIPAGSKFYLVTELDPTTEEDADKTGNKVFMQDYTTIAMLTIGSESLQSAYNVVPDLRSPKLELGLSVDLEWQEGATYEHEF